MFPGEALLLRLGLLCGVDLSSIKVQIMIDEIVVIWSFVHAIQEGYAYYLFNCINQDDRLVATQSHGGIDCIE